jgi:hypothetical protein
LDFDYNYKSWHKRRLYLPQKTKGDDGRLKVSMRQVGRTNKWECMDTRGVGFRLSRDIEDRSLLRGPNHYEHVTAVGTSILKDKTTGEAIIWIEVELDVEGKDYVTGLHNGFEGNMLLEKRRCVGNCKTPNIGYKSKDWLVQGGINSWKHSKTFASIRDMYKTQRYKVFKTFGKVYKTFKADGTKCQADLLDD